MNHSQPALDKRTEFGGFFQSQETQENLARLNQVVSLFRYVRFVKSGLMCGFGEEKEEENAENPPDND